MYDCMRLLFVKTFLKRFRDRRKNSLLKSVFFYQEEKDKEIIHHEPLEVFRLSLEMQLSEKVSFSTFFQVYLLLNQFKARSGILT